MRKFLIAGAVLALAACGSTDEVDEANVAADNLMLEDNMMLDENLTMDAINGMEANGTVDANTANLMMEDATTNDADTNLANGM